MPTKKKKFPAVVVRAYSGVFFGYMRSRSGGPEAFTVELERARHIWSWDSSGLARKALTVEDIGLIGVGNAKISGVTSVSLADVKCIVPATPEAVKRIEGALCQ